MHPIKHVMSVDGLTLTSTTVIEDRDVTLSTTWDTEEKAEDNYYVTLRLHERRLTEIAAAGVDNVTKRTGSVRRLFTLGNYEVSVGNMRGQAFDDAMVTFGGHIWRAPIDAGTGHLNWRNLRRGEVDTSARNLYGIGFRTWAAYVSVQPRENADAR